MIEKALETGTFLEINSQPDRLDLTDVHARAAREAGLKLVIDSDGHQISALGYVELGVGQARRAWLTTDDVVNTRTWKQIERLRKRRRDEIPAQRLRDVTYIYITRPRSAPMTFRDDLAAASDWVASYLETIGERPVMARVEPGEIRREAASRRRPRRAEPFADVLRDLDELIVPGLTLWNHPRFFAYFANTGSEPGILAELLIAALNVNAMAWATSPAATELEQVTSSTGSRSCSACRRGSHGHIEDTASTSTLAALAAARGSCGRAASCTPPSRRTSRSRRPRGSSGSSYRTVPVDDEFRMLTDFPLDDATAVVATVGTTLDHLGRSRA